MDFNRWQLGLLYLFDYFSFILLHLKVKTILQSHDAVR
jgi:hypothetical protein